MAEPKIGRSAIPSGMSLPPEIDADAAADFIRGAKVTAGQVSMPAQTPAPAPVKQQAATKPNAKRLFVTGRLPDRIGRRKVALGVLQPLWDEIESLCMGGDQAVLNYLLREGLANLKARSEPIMLDAEELGDSEGEG